MPGSNGEDCDDGDAHNLGTQFGARAAVRCGQRLPATRDIPHIAPLASVLRDINIEEDSLPCMTMQRRCSAMCTGPSETQAD